MLASAFQDLDNATLSAEALIAAATTALYEWRAGASQTFKGATACARCYVILPSLTRKQVDAVKAWAARESVRFQTRSHYGFSNALYLGYDNATGIEAGKAERFAARLKELGVGAYADFGED